VAQELATQIEAGSKRVFGVMVESHLHGGAQKFTPGKDRADQLAYGQSITDACLDWDASVAVLERLSAAVIKRRQA
jgi:3-deoxy-7-phosphoheptulonate synthase